MPYQSPSFYAYHALREAQTITTNNDPTTESISRVHDSLQGQIFDYTSADFLTGPASKRIMITLEGAGTPSDDLDTLIISGHNINGNTLDAFSNPVSQGVDNNDRISPDYVVVEANGVPIIRPLSSSTGGDLLFTMKIDQGGGINRVPELTEVFLSKKLTMVRGPEPGWQHPWRRTQRRLINDAGVTSTQLLGAARKTFVLTWQGLEGADRQLLFDLQVQTNDWSEPFWFDPPDDIYETLFMELDRDSGWIQDQANPLDQGTADQVTFPMIEVLG